MDSGVQEALADESLEGITAKRMKKEPGITGKSVTVLRRRDVIVRSGIAFMPNTIEMAQLKKREKGQFKTNVQFCSKMTEADVKKLLMDTFPYLENQRFYCAAAADNRTRLDFHGQPRIWDGQFIKRKIKGNSALYILTDEESDDGLDSKVPEQMTLKRSHDQITSPENEMSEQSLKTGTKSANTLNVLTGFKAAVHGSSILTGATAEGSQPKLPEKMSQMVPCIYVPVTGQHGMSSVLCPSISATHDTKKGNDIAVSLAPLSQSLLLDSAVQSGAIPKARISTASNQQSLSKTADGSSNTRQARLPLAVHKMPQEMHSVLTPDMNKLHIFSSQSPGQLQKTVNVEKSVLTRDQRAWTTEGRGSSEVGLPVTTTAQGDKSFELVKGAGTGFQQGARMVLSDLPSHATDDQPDSGFSDAEEKGASGNSAAEAAVQSDSGLENIGAPSTNPNTCIQDQNYSSKDLILDWIETPLGTFPDEDFALYLNTDIQEIATDPRPCQIPAGAVITGAENGISSKGVVQNPRIVPSSSGMEGGVEFHIAFHERLAEQVTSGQALFKGVAFAPLWKYSECDLAGTVPSSTKPGIFDVTVFDQTGNYLGMTKFSYTSPAPAPLETVQQALRDENLGTLFLMLAQKFGSLQVSAGDNNAAQGSGPLNMQDQGQTQQQQSLQLLQLLVYTAAETGAQELIEIIFSTSAGRTVFYSYKDKTPLPEDVARANGHTYLAQYLQDVNTRLSKEVGSEAQSNAIDWLELVKAVQTQASAAQVKSVKEEKHPSESDDNSSDYFADSETSSHGSKPYSDSDSSIDKGNEENHGVYGFIRDLIVEGKDARFVNKTGRYVISWSKAIYRYVDFKSKKNPQFKIKKCNRRKTSNGLRAALLNFYKKEGAREYKESQKVNEKDEVVERQFQMPPRVFESLFKNVKLADDSEPDEQDTSSIKSEGESEAQSPSHSSTSDAGFDETMSMTTEGTSGIEADIDDILDNIPSNPSLNVVKTEEDGDLFLPDTMQRSEMFDTSAVDSALEEICSDRISDDLDFVGAVQDICPMSGSVKGGYHFYVSLTEQLPDTVTTGIVQFEGVANVEAQKLNPYTLSGILPYPGFPSKSDESSDYFADAEMSSCGLFDLDEANQSDSEDKDSRDEGFCTKDVTSKEEPNKRPATSMKEPTNEIPDTKEKLSDNKVDKGSPRWWHSYSLSGWLSKWQKSKSTSPMPPSISSNMKDETDSSTFRRFPGVTPGLFDERSTSGQANGHTTGKPRTAKPKDVTKKRSPERAATGLKYKGFLLAFAMVTVLAGLKLGEGYVLHWAVGNGYTRISKLLLHCGVNVDAPGLFQETPLHLAAKHGFKDLVDILVQNGGNINAMNFPCEETPLHLAVGYGHQHIAESLIQHGSDVNARDINQETPLHFAARCGRQHIAESLIQHGSDVNARDINQETPLHFAALRGRQHFAESLIQHGNGVNARSKPLKNTSLHLAAWNGHKQVVDILLRRGSDANARNVPWQETPLHLAAQNGHQHIVESLIQHGGQINVQNNVWQEIFHFMTITERFKGVANVVKFRTVIECGHSTYTCAPTGVLISSKRIRFDTWTRKEKEAWKNSTEEGHVQIIVLPCRNRTVDMKFEMGAFHRTQRSAHQGNASYYQMCSSFSTYAKEVPQNYFRVDGLCDTHACEVWSSHVKNETNGLLLGDVLFPRVSPSSGQCQQHRVTNSADHCQQQSRVVSSDQSMDKQARIKMGKLVKVVGAISIVCFVVACLLLYIYRFRVLTTIGRAEPNVSPCPEPLLGPGIEILHPNIKYLHDLSIVDIPIKKVSMKELQLEHVSSWKKRLIDQKIVLSSDFYQDEDNLYYH